VNLPPSILGTNLQFRWRIGGDNSAAATGWFVDTVSLTQDRFACAVPAQPLILNPHLGDADNLAFSYYSVPEQTYFIESTTNLESASWTTLKTNAGNGTLLLHTNSTANPGERCFRIRTH
jgi:hypothetical protein